MNNLLARNIFWIFLILTLSTNYYISEIHVVEFNLNRTVGHGWSSWLLAPETIWVDVGIWFNYFACLFYFILFIMVLVSFNAI